MVKKQWTVSIENRDRNIELIWRPFFKQTISVDGAVTVLPKPSIWALFDLSNDYPFEMGDRPGILHVRNNGYAYQFDLSVDGCSVTTGEAVAANHPLPKWVYPFMAACLLIPVLTLGGGIPIAIGFIGSGSCYAIAQNPARSKSTRVLSCAGVTALCWILLIVLAIAVQSIAG